MFTLAHGHESARVGRGSDCLHASCADPQNSGPGSTGHGFSNRAHAYGPGSE